MIDAYPKVWALGKAPLFDPSENATFLQGECVVQEKVDGSQISFGVIDGAVMIRSKNQDISTDQDGMFFAAIEAIYKAKANLPEGLVFRGEYLAKPKHNTLTYGRIPKNHIAVYDIWDSTSGRWLDTAEVRLFAYQAGFDIVPTLYVGSIWQKSDLDAFLEKESFLGGPNIEGVVIKRYDVANRSHAVTFCKYVSEAFREMHTKSWKAQNPTTSDFVQDLGSSFATETRWLKAVHRLRDQGRLKGDMSDVGLLLKDLSEDFETEWEHECAKRLYRHFRKRLIKAANAGFPQWYASNLAEAGTPEAA